MTIAVDVRVDGYVVSNEDHLMINNIEEWKGLIIATAFLNFTA